jgi:adenylate cyclase
MNAYRAMGAELWRPFFLFLLASAHLKADDVRNALAILSEAIAVVDKSGERWWLPELLRLQGELLLKDGMLQSTRAAQNSFEGAIMIAKEQHSRSLELRSAMSLARLLAQQGRGDEARSLLAHIYGWFTEGFDTADVKEAKALLDVLS